MIFLQLACINMLLVATGHQVCGIRSTRNTCGEDMSPGCMHADLQTKKVIDSNERSTNLKEKSGVS